MADKLWLYQELGNIRAPTLVTHGEQVKKWLLLQIFLRTFNGEEFSEYRLFIAICWLF